MIKSGDIIPCVKTILYASDSFVLPTACPECVCKLTFDGIHLMCNNLHCPGKIVKKLHTAAKDIDMKNVGKETLRKFSCDFDNLYELMIWVLDMSNNHKEFERFGFKSGSRSLTIFIDSFKNIRSLSVAKVILLFGHENVGLKLTEQVAKMYYDIEPDFKCQEKALVGYFKQEHVRTYILDCVKNLESFNIKIDKPLNREDDNMKTTIYICMTGTPVPVNKTKEEFISQFSNIEEVSLTDKKCNYLITNSVSSETSKMKMAKKKNIDIITYEDFINKFKSL
jgi:NAD-dependent DNA ligase